MNLINVCINVCKTMQQLLMLITVCECILSSWRLTASSLTSVCMWWARLFHGLSSWPTRVHWPPTSAWTPPRFSVQKLAKSRCHLWSLPTHARSDSRSRVSVSVMAYSYKILQLVWWLKYVAIWIISCMKSNECVCCRLTGDKQSKHNICICIHGHCRTPTKARQSGALWGNAAWATRWSYLTYAHMHQIIIFTLN